MKISLFALAMLFQFSMAAAVANPGGSASLEEGRLKVQFHIHKNKSKGSYRLRELLERHGFKNKNGFVETGGALAPLELYNYLYDDGRYAFTIFLPVSDKKFFISFDAAGFLSFKGKAAQRLFDVIKHYLPRTDINGLEKYRWDETNYCDRTIVAPTAYRCFINR